MSLHRRSTVTLTASVQTPSQLLWLTRPRHNRPLAASSPMRRPRWQPPVSVLLRMVPSLPTTDGATPTQLHQRLRRILQEGMRKNSLPQSLAELTQPRPPVARDAGAGDGDAGAEPRQPMTRSRLLPPGQLQGARNSPETTCIRTPSVSVPAPPLKRACASDLHHSMPSACKPSAASALSLQAVPARVRGALRTAFRADLQLVLHPPDPDDEVNSRLEAIHPRSSHAAVPIGQRVARSPG